MIRHIVFFSVRDQADRDQVEQGLKLLAAIPQARNFEVGHNLKRDAISEPVDFVVYCEFDDEAALDAYKADPLYQRSIDVVRPLRELRIAADLVSPVPAARD